MREIGGVVEGSGICRILPFCESGSAGKTEICRPDPGFALQRPAVLLIKIELRSEIFVFTPHFRKTERYYCDMRSPKASSPTGRLTFHLFRQRAVNVIEK